MFCQYQIHPTPYPLCVVYTAEWLVFLAPVVIFVLSCTDPRCRPLRQLQYNSQHFRLWTTIAHAVALASSGAASYCCVAFRQVNAVLDKILHKLLWKRNRSRPEADSLEGVVPTVKAAVQYLLRVCHPLIDTCKRELGRRRRAFFLLLSSSSSRHS